MNAPAPRIVIVDDDEDMRNALRRLLRAAGWEVVAFDSAAAYLAAYDPAVPGCVVLDINMPDTDGLALQEILHDRGEAPPIIFLTGHADVPGSLQAMKRGAFEFLLKPLEDVALIGAVRGAVEHDRTRRAVSAEIAAIRQRFELLTPREAEVLGYVIAGKLNKVTADALGTVEKTVKVHRARVMEKMQVGSLAELVRDALRAGVPSRF